MGIDYYTALFTSQPFYVAWSRHERAVGVKVSHSYLLPALLLTTDQKTHPTPRPVLLG